MLFFVLPNGFLLMQKRCILSKIVITKTSVTWQKRRRNRSGKVSLRSLKSLWIFFFPNCGHPAVSVLRSMLPRSARPASVIFCQLRHILCTFSTDSAVTLVHGFVMSWVDYCNVILLGLQRLWLMSCIECWTRQLMWLLTRGRST